MHKRVEPSNEVNIHIGMRLRMRRESLRISQEKVGQRLGVSFQQVQKFEKGANRIGADQLLAVATFLGVDANYFFEGLVEKFVDPQVFDTRPQPGSSDGAMEGVELNRAFMQIKGGATRRSIIDMVKAVARGQ